MEQNTHQRIAKKIEVAANLGIVVVALLAAGFFAKSYFARSPEPRQTISIGSKLAIKGVDWGSRRATLVLALSTNCRFCTESAPFYRELTKEAKEKQVHTIAIFPQSVQDASAYLKNEGLEVDEIRQTPLSAIQVSGTPTLLLIDPTGTVQGVWIGKLLAEKEKDVRAKLAS